MLNNKRKKNKHKSGYMEELSQEKNLLETREERLEKIRKAQEAKELASKNMEGENK